MKASRYEREFCEYAENRGYHAERVAGSGFRKDSVCDAVLIKDGQGYLVEIKSTKDGTFYVSDNLGTRQRLNTLMRVAKKSGAIPLLAVRFKKRGKRKTWIVKMLSSEFDKISRNAESFFK